MQKTAKSAVANKGTCYLGFGEQKRKEIKKHQAEKR
jgi:hypothetical protein